MTRSSQKQKRMDEMLVYRMTSFELMMNFCCYMHISVRDITKQTLCYLYVWYWEKFYFNFGKHFPSGILDS